jgi:hypothetical protein
MEENEEARCEDELELSRERRHITGSEFDGFCDEIRARLLILETQMKQVLVDLEALKGPCAKT